MFHHDIRCNIDIGEAAEEYRAGEMLKELPKFFIKKTKRKTR